MSPILNGSSLFTVSRNDIYDYYRCPKIISIKTYTKTRYRAERTETRESDSISPAITGRVGEIATEAILQGPVLSRMGIERNERVTEGQIQSVVLRELQPELEGLSGRVKRDLKKVIIQTLQGVKEIRSQIANTVGELIVIGKGESRYGSLLAAGFPDFIAIAAHDKPILIEVKNGQVEHRTQDILQASYYNTLGNTVGIALQDVGLHDDKPRLSPKIIVERDAETVLVYPRVGKCKTVTDTLEISDADVKEVWRAKELGLVGKTPATNCDPNCPHTRLTPQLPECDLEEVAKPLPLIFAKGSLDLGVDCDCAYAQSRLWRVAPSLVRSLWQLEGSPSGTRFSAMLTAEKILREDLGFDSSTADKMVKHFARPETSSLTWIDSEKIVREMANEIAVWREFVPKRVLTRLWPVAQGRARRIYALPRRSGEIIRKTWEKW